MMLRTGKSLFQRAFKPQTPLLFPRPLGMMSQRPMALFSSGDNYENLIVEKKEEGVLLITLNRPKALNALCLALF